jgi:hypothetical protein
MFENRARYLEDLGHHGVLRDDIDGDKHHLQKELDLLRKHSAVSLERFRGIESEMKRGAFALVDKEEALAKVRPGVIGVWA